MFWVGIVQQTIAIRRHQTRRNMQQENRDSLEGNATVALTRAGPWATPRACLKTAFGFPYRSKLRSMTTPSLALSATRMGRSK
jgi:hypothetical protein